MDTKCEVCTEALAKYKCPLCSKQTCSLPCVRRHKVEFSCTGKRSRTDNVRIKDFKDSTIVKDFELLEDSKDSLYRCRPNARPDVLRRRDKLKSECYQRGIHLRLMPHVFTLAQSNSSTVRNRKDAETEQTSTEILWKLDWHFENLDRILSDTCVSENKSLEELIERFLNDSWKLGPTRQILEACEAPVDLNAMDVFLVNHQQNELPVNLASSVKEALTNHAILEYPTFRIRHRTSRPFVSTEVISDT